MSKRSLCIKCKDHPRPCGEKSNLQCLPNLQLGSPPPMRGKGYLQAALVARAGITPAHAGKSVCDKRIFILCGDHPRPCGEKEPVKYILSQIKGSPPPMRGKEA